MRRSPLILSLLALALALPVPRTASVHAAGVTIETVSEGVQATAPAERLRTVPPLNFPMAPTPRCNILDNFGDGRSGGRSHAGSDMLATLGQEVYAMADGTLTYQLRVGDGKSGTSLSGNLWELTSADGSGTYYIYAHLSTFAPGLQVGSSVFRGQVIGYVGDTGNPGPGNYHLHFEIHPGGGAAVNPLPLITIPPTCTVF
jgi:peptidoglycan LD-endopeptidase LytH